MRTTFLGFLLLSAFALNTRAEGPNIVFILADDLGWSDLACYGNDWIETPHLDRLAAEGVRFTQAYAAAPICSASRAAILSGKTTAQLGFEFVTKNEPGGQTLNAPLRAPPFTLNLDLDEWTFAEAHRYRYHSTGFVGKWHLNQHYQRYLGWSPTHGPKQHGFDYAKEGFGSHPYSYYRKGGDRSFLELADGEFPEDSVTEHAIDFIEQEHEDKFFLIVSHYYVHDPIHTRIKWLHDHYLTKIPESHPRRKILAHYGAMVTTLDHYVGQLVIALQDSGKEDETVIFFTSDNGGHPNYAGNAPLRGSKWNLYEGGIRVPLIVSGFPNRGIVCEEPVHSIDLYPTFLMLADAGLKEAVEGESLFPYLIPDDLVTDPVGDAFSGSTEQQEPPARPLFWHFPYYHPEKKYAESPDSIGINDGVTSKTKPHSAIRKGDWKLLHFYEDDRIELYHLSNDLSEQNDLSKTNPDKAAALQKELADYLIEVDARFPKKNPDYTPE